MSNLANRLTLTLVVLVACLATTQATAAYPAFTCAYERDTNPPLDAQAEKYFQEARHLEKIEGVKDWVKIVSLYDKAIEKNHWKAMHNMADLYRTGWPGRPGIKKDTGKMIDLYKGMIELKVPLGYYNWAVVAEHGNGILKSDRMASSYMYQAAQMGSPLAQARIGKYFAFELPRDRQDDDMAEQYYQCAGAQDDISAILEAANFYEIAKENKPRALFYNQRAAQLGSSWAAQSLKGAFAEKIDDIFNYGYKPNSDEYIFYSDLYKKLRADPSQRFPNLIAERPLPKHPTQGYDAEHPDRRPEL